MSVLVPVVLGCALEKEQGDELSWHQEAQDQIWAAKLGAFQDAGGDVEALAKDIKHGREKVKSQYRLQRNFAAV